MDPKSLRYTETHEWVSLEGDVCTVGVTQFAADQLTDITYVEFKDVGTRLKAGDDFGKIETVKAVSDLYAPVAGEVVAVNEKIVADNETFKADPYGKGWMVKIKVAPGTTLDHLKTLEQYQQQLASEGH
jgi:glycine cleavage system H protein